MKPFATDSMKATTVSTRLTVIYRRVSTGLQDNSLEVQESRNDDYCRFRELRNLETITDEATSGTVPVAERTGGARLLRLIEADTVGHLVVAKLDRLGRSARDLLEFCEILERHGVDLHIVDFGVNTQSPAGKLLFGMMAMFAEFEVATIRERIRLTLAHKHAQGELVSHPPYGWNAVETGRSSKRGKPIRVLEPNLEEQGWVRFMIALKENGCSLSAIARQLNALGCPTKVPAGTRKARPGGGFITASGRWGVGSVSHVLGSRYTASLLNPLPQTTIPS